MVLDTPATPTEKVLGVGANVIVYRGLADAVGLPAWLGALVAAASMVIAADDTADPRMRRVAGLLSAPGAVLIHALREHQLTAVPAEEANDA